jgi:predicted nuclease with TOPRIM domain
MVYHIQLKHVLDLLSNNTKVKDENSALHIRIGDLEKVLANLQSSYNSLNEKRATLSAHSAALEEQTTRLQGQCECLMKEKAALKNQCDVHLRDNKILAPAVVILVLVLFAMIIF